MGGGGRGRGFTMDATQIRMGLTSVFGAQTLILKLSQNLDR